MYPQHPLICYLYIIWYFWPVAKIIPMNFSELKSFQQRNSYHDWIVKSSAPILQKTTILLETLWLLLPMGTRLISRHFQSFTWAVPWAKMLVEFLDSTRSETETRELLGKQGVNPSWKYLCTQSWITVFSKPKPSGWGAIWKGNFPRCCSWYMFLHFSFLLLPPWLSLKIRDGEL